MVDQTDVETRDDVLVYTSPVLESDLTIAGPLRADLYVSSSAKDTDLVAKLVDVFPDGRALNIQEGALRLRYRDSYVAPELMTPGRCTACRWTCARSPTSCRRAIACGCRSRAATFRGWSAT